MMRLKSITLICVLISQCPIIGYAQRFLPEYNLKRDNLLSNKVELIIEYEFLQQGIIFIQENVEDCFSYSPLYLFWIENGNFYKQKFTECQTSPIMKLTYSDFLDLASKNLIKIKNAKILAAKSNNVTEVYVSHDDEWIFKFHSDNNNFEKVISDFSLNTRMLEENEPNLNYWVNQNSILKKLIDLVSAETD